MTALPTLVKFLELNWSKMAELEVQHMRKDQLIESLRVRQCQASGQPRRPSRVLRVQFQGASYDWLDLEESQDLLQANDFAETIRENFAYYFGVPFECQAIYCEEGLLKSAADFRRALQGPSPTVALYDIRGMVVEAKEEFAHRLVEVNTDLERGLEEKDHVIEQLQREPSAEREQLRPPAPERLSSDDFAQPRRPRMLYVEYQGQVYEWFNLDRHRGLVQACNAERTLRDNVSHYFGVPPERQVVADDCGPLASPADFARALEAPCPLLRLRDAGTTRLEAPGSAHSPAAMPTGRTAAIAPGTAGAWAAPHVQQVLAAPPEPVAVAPGPAHGRQPLPECGSSLSQPQGISRAVSFGDREAAATFFEGTLLDAPCRSSSSNVGAAAPAEPAPATASEVELLLSKSASGSGFGFAVVPASTNGFPEPAGSAKALGISWIDEWGLLARWNRLYPPRALSPGDVLLSVNGRCDAEAMREQLLHAETVHMLGRQRRAVVH